MWLNIDVEVNLPFAERSGPCHGGTPAADPKWKIVRSPFQLLGPYPYQSPSFQGVRAVPLLFQPLLGEAYHDPIHSISGKWFLK